MFNLRYLRYMRNRKTQNAINFYSRTRSYYEFSNFHEASFEINGLYFPSVEHYFQYEKFIENSPEYAEKIRTCESPSMAKRMGRSRRYPVPYDWDTRRLKVMEKALYAKFTQNEDLKELLLSTGDRTLREDSPTDYFWGMGKYRTGYNLLGHLLMNLRDDLRDKEHIKAIERAVITIEKAQQAQK